MNRKSQEDKNIICFKFLFYFSEPQNIDILVSDRWVDINSHVKPFSNSPFYFVHFYYPPFFCIFHVCTLKYVYVFLYNCILSQYCDLIINNGNKLHSIYPIIKAAL